jgi:hypothetical protein
MKGLEAYFVPNAPVLNKIMQKNGGSKPIFDLFFA